MRSKVFNIIKAYLILRFCDTTLLSEKEEGNFISLIYEDCCVIKYALMGDSNTILVEYLESNDIPMKERKAMDLAEVRRHFIVVMWNRLPVLID